MLADPYADGKGRIFLLLGFLQVKSRARLLTVGNSQGSLDFGLQLLRV